MTQTTYTKFNLPLSPDHRAKLEAIRARLGLRSQAEALRALIDREVKTS
jgi:hypothetical protein